MAAGLYELTKEYLAATPERRQEIERERARLFPSVRGWPSKPSMVYQEVAQNAWDWDEPRFGVRCLDNTGRVVGGSAVKFDRSGLDRLIGHSSRGIILVDTLIRYVAGVVTRERERLARALDGHLPPDVLARITSNIDDEKVFRFKGPESSLEHDGTPPPELMPPQPPATQR